MLSRIEQNELGWRLLSVIRRKNPYCTAISPYRLGTVDGIAKKNLPGKLFFFDHLPVPLHCTYILCTQGHHNISLIGQTLVVFCWFRVGGHLTRD